jgi:hypothetical protein
MSKPLLVVKLFSEERMCKVLGISQPTLYGLRKSGCPWVELGGKPFYYEPEFMAWLLKNKIKNVEVS